jgi:hypothetical protein
MSHLTRWSLAVTLTVAVVLSLSCGPDDDDADANPPADDDLDDDDLSPPPADDDDNNDNDSSGDDESPAVDDILPDDFVAAWPQTNVEPPNYDESAEPGPLRLKAEAYDDWLVQRHQPFYGSTLEILYTDDTRTEVELYIGTWDSCFWTGAYLASQAFRYYVTGDPQAKANALRSVEALDGHLHVTGKPGYLARYRGPQDPLVLPADCAEFEGCHFVDDGPFAGDFWIGNTSRDQYHGWLMGLALAYDLVDDEPMRELIRDDVTEVLDYLIGNHWWAVDWADEPHALPAIVLPNMRLLWSLIGYHLTGEERFKAAAQEWLRDENRRTLAIAGLSWPSRYMEFYGNNLAHQLYYNLLRLGRAYFSRDDYEFFERLFEEQAHRWVRLSHNAFFNLVHMSQGDYTPGRDDEYQAQLELDLADFHEAPVYQYAMTPPPAELDLFSLWAAAFLDAHPLIAALIGSDIEPQAKEAYRVLYQCSSHYFWEHSPFRISCENPEMWRYVYPGFDYLLVYWMAEYHRFTGKEQ